MIDRILDNKLIRLKGTDLTQVSDKLSLGTMLDFSHYVCLNALLNKGMFPYLPSHVSSFHDTLLIFPSIFSIISQMLHVHSRTNVHTLSHPDINYTKHVLSQHSQVSSPPKTRTLSKVVLCAQVTCGVSQKSLLNLPLQYP